MIFWATKLDSYQQFLHFLKMISHKSALLLFRSLVICSGFLISSISLGFVVVGFLQYNSQLFVWIAPWLQNKETHNGHFFDSKQNELRKQKKKGLVYFRHKIKSENKKHPLYPTFIESPFSSFNHGCDILDTNYHSVFSNSFKMIRAMIQPFR